MVNVAVIKTTMKKKWRILNVKLNQN